MADMSQGNASVLINGDSTRCLDFADRGLQYGDGIFSTVSVRNGIPLFLSRHLARLQTDALSLSIPFPDIRVLTDEAYRLCAHHPESVLKIMLTRGMGGRGYRFIEQGKATRILCSHPKPDYPEEIWKKGVKARVCDLRLGINPRLAGIKHLNRLEQVLARAEWIDDDISEGLLMDHEGFLVEGVMSNVFLAREGFLRTPLLDRCGVAGVMRGLVLEAARELGLTVEESRLRLDEAIGADELFLTNSVIGVWPVRALDDKQFPVGEITRLLAERIHAMAGEEPKCA